MGNCGYERKGPNEGIGSAWRACWQRVCGLWERQAGWAIDTDTSCEPDSLACAVPCSSEGELCPVGCGGPGGGERGAAAGGQCACGAGLRWPEAELFKRLLSPVKSLAATWARGPHARSNWLPVGEHLQPRLLGGGWPFRLPEWEEFDGESEAQGSDKLRCLLGAGVTTFVNLTADDECLVNSEGSSYGFWEPRARSLAADLHGGIEKQLERGKGLNFDIACPMPDEMVASDLDLALLLRALLEELRDGRRVLYVHCLGGHGRSGVAGCSLLCLAYPGLAGLPEAFVEAWARAPIREQLFPPNLLAKLHRSFAPGAARLAEGAVAAFNRLHAERECEHGGGHLRFPHSYKQIAQVARVAAAQGPFADLRALLEGMTAAELTSRSDLERVVPPE